MYYHILLLIISYIKGEINQISISYDDIDNINGENVLKKCYESCKQCEIGGNSINHHCTECIENYYIFSEDPTSITEPFNCYNQDYIIENIIKKMKE